MEKKFIVAVDLDETLLTSDKKVTQKTLDVLNACKGKGAYIVISTARGYGNTKHIADLIGADYSCCQTGNFLFNNNTNSVEYKNPIDSNVKNEFIKKFSLYTDEIFCDGLFSIFGKDTYYSREWKVTPCDKDYLLNLETLKICIRHTEDYREKIEEFCNLHNLTYRKMRGAEFSLISPYGTDKWNALSELIEITGIDKQNVFVFGDDVSDILSLQSVGHGVAMANSRQEVLDKISNVTLSNDEDGVAHYLEKNLLKQKNNAKNCEK